MPGREIQSEVLRLRPHPVVFGGAASFAAFVALVAALLIAHNDLRPETDWRIVFVAAAVALGGFVGPTLRWARAWVELSADRLAWSVGWLRPTHLAADLADLQGLAVDQGVLGRLLGYGVLRVVDAAGRERVFLPVGHVEGFREAAARCGSRSKRAGRRER